MAQIPVSGHSTPWFAGRRPAVGARLRLFCFPYAGLGTSAYRGWPELFGSAVDVLPVQLPGRESRHHETPFRRMDDLIGATVEAIEPFVDVPFALMGHSLGAAVAFELARHFADAAPPERIFVSARRAPHLAEPAAPIAHLPEGQFLAAVQQRYAGIPAAILESPDLLELLLPRLRADLELLETYKFRPGPPLPCPISVFGGLQDKTVSRHELESWHVHSSAQTQLRMLPGPHLFLQEQRTAIAAAITEDLGLARVSSAVGA